MTGGQRSRRPGSMEVRGGGWMAEGARRVHGEDA